MTRESDSGRKVDLERFAAMVDAYGAAEEAWPAEERAGALSLLAASEEAVRLRERAAVLDALLGDLPSPDPSPALRGRILDQAPRPARGSGRWSRILEELWPFGPSWQPAAALAAAAVLGVTFGLVMPESEQATETTVVAEVALDTVDLDTVAGEWSEAP